MVIIAAVVVVLFLRDSSPSPIGSDVQAFRMQLVLLGKLGADAEKERIYTKAAGSRVFGADRTLPFVWARWFLAFGAAAGDGMETLPGRFRGPGVQPDL